MKKLVIAIDCDDVLVPSTHAIVDLYNQRHGTRVSYERSHQSGNDEWGVSREETKQRIHAVQLSSEYRHLQPFPEAVQAVRLLAADGHELHMVTARDKKLLEVTEMMLRDYFDDDVFTTIEYIGMDGTKGDICQGLNADVLIDDNLKHLVHAAECGVGGLLWFGNYPWQTDEVVQQGVKRCADWDEVLQEINRIART